MTYAEAAASIWVKGTTISVTLLPERQTNVCGGRRNS